MTAINDAACIECLFFAKTTIEFDKFTVPLVPLTFGQFRIDHWYGIWEPSGVVFQLIGHVALFNVTTDININV